MYLSFVSTWLKPTTMLVTNVNLNQDLTILWMGAICWGFIRRESQITFVIQSNRTALTVDKVDARVQLKCYKAKMFIEKLSSHYYVVNKKWFL